MLHEASSKGRVPDSEQGYTAVHIGDIHEGEEGHMSTGLEDLWKFIEAARDHVQDNGELYGLNYDIHLNELCIIYNTLQAEEDKGDDKRSAQS